MSNGLDLWLKIFNSDLEEPVLANLHINKNFRDEGSEDERREIVNALENKSLSWILDCYFWYKGHGIYSNDIKYLLIDLLKINSIKQLEALGE